ncbi:MAG: cell division/cell wall cluster transcriptional repressor MraZ [Oscillospiraceae bacterium]|nr:cell division/cell wall cluster transcriptional repressor MraZ [Oscillospiraceae bacterium]
MRGEATSTLDVKGRLNFPAAFRKGFGDSFVLVKALKVPCIQVYSTEHWEEFKTSLLSNSPRTKAEQVLRFISATDGETDKQGRFFMPAHLRKYANLDSEVVFKDLGIDGKIEIWSAAELERNVESIDIDSLVDELSL